MVRRLIPALAVAFGFSISQMPTYSDAHAEGIENGVRSSRHPESIDASKQEVSQSRATLEPRTALATNINFDDAPASCLFINTTALRNAYQSLGVVFSGPGANDGGAILDQCGQFGVSGYSAPNFLAFNSIAVMADGGIPFGPERMSFSNDVSSVRVGVASRGGTATLTAYSATLQVVASVSLPVTNALQFLQVSAPGIRFVDLNVPNSSGGAWVVDDLSFEVAPRCPANNVAPAFVSPTPTCGSTLTAIAGTPIAFTVHSADPDSGDTITLDVGGLPSGASLTPPLPQHGNPALSTFNWVPGVADSGDHHLTFTATDGCHTAVTCDVTVRVLTNRPPDCSRALACEPVLWPPNHAFHAVSICGVTDPDSGDVVTITVTSVTQDEPTNTRGDGSTCPDAQIVAGQASVRAERTGTPSVPGNGRVYTIGFTADDGHGGQCTDTVYVCVPHDQGDPTCINDGQRYNSLGPCRGGNQLGVEQASLAIGDVSNGQAHLTFALPVDGPVEIAAFDVAGRRLATIVSEVLPSGIYERDWNMGGIPKGLYFVRVQAGGVKLTRTVIKLQ